MKKKKFMLEALKLAQKGEGLVSPNPMVGCVIVKNGKIVGKGFHELLGGKHAEVNALENALGKAKGAEMYVTLEPCNHFGKQPPCTKAIIRAGIKKVFIAIKDPNKKSLSGAEKLRKAGIVVETGLCGKEAEKLNEFYIMSLGMKRPFIILKTAMSIDGKISFGNGKRKKISGPEAFKFAQELRKKCDAVIVGIGTVLKDNPRLSYRKNSELNPLRVVIDSQARIPENAKMFSEQGETVVACSGKAEKNKIERLRKSGAKILMCGFGAEGKVDLRELVTKLYSLGVRSAVVETGGKIGSAFLAEKLFDRLLIVVSPKKIGKGLEAFRLERAVKAKIVSMKRLGKDLLLELEKA